MASRTKCFMHASYRVQIYSFFFFNEQKHRLQFQRLHDLLVGVLGFGKVSSGVSSFGFFMLPPVWVVSSALCQSEA